MNRVRRLGETKRAGHLGLGLAPGSGQGTAPAPTLPGLPNLPKITRAKDSGPARPATDGGQSKLVTPRPTPPKANAA